MMRSGSDTGTDLTTIERDAALGPGGVDCLDLAGAATSGLCALHCALMPALSAILPMIGLGILGGEGFETTLLGASAALATVSIGIGYRRHRSGRVVAVIAAGLGLLAVGHLVEERGYESAGVVAIVAGGLVVAGAHLINRRLCRSCPVCREARPGCGDPPASRLLHVSRPVAAGTTGGAIPRNRESPSDPDADRRSASLASIR